MQGELPEKIYIQALIDDFKQKLPQIQSRSLHSIFIGGGTPSLFSADAYAILLDAINKDLSIANDIEITIEANPGTAEQQRFSGYRKAGINRISLGIQSLQDDKLKRLSRVHSAGEAQRAVALAHDAGFANFNLDFMFGLPEQSIDDALFDLAQGLALKPKHFSWYQLTLEPNTFFYTHRPKLPHEDRIWEMQVQGQQLLKGHGFQHYEVSAYCLPGFESRHNLNYWNFGDYIGIGAGAHGKFTDFTQQRITRYWNMRSPSHYLDPHKNIIAGEKIIAREELAFEFMMNALRLQTPVPVSLFENRTGLSLADIQPELKRARELELLNIENNCFTVTERGKVYLNQLLEIFLQSK